MKIRPRQREQKVLSRADLEANLARLERTLQRTERDLQRAERFVDLHRHFWAQLGVKFRLEELILDLPAQPRAPTRRR